SVERRKHFRGEPAGFAQHSGEIIVGEVLVKKPVGPRFGEPRRMLEAEDDILDRRPIGHDLRFSGYPLSPQASRSARSAATVQGATGRTALPPKPGRTVVREQNRSNVAIVSG